MLGILSMCHYWYKMEFFRVTSTRVYVQRDNNEANGQGWVTAATGVDTHVIRNEYVSRILTFSCSGWEEFLWSYIRSLPKQRENDTLMKGRTDRGETQREVERKRRPTALPADKDYTFIQTPSTTTISSSLCFIGKVEIQAGTHGVFTRRAEPSTQTIPVS